jgi:hypothetical protein
VKAPLALLALLGLAACQVIDRIVPVTEAPASDAPATPRSGAAAPSPAEDIVAYLTRLRGMTENSLAAEAARQKQLATRADDDTARLKAALALSVANPSDDSEILALVDPLVRKESASGDLRAMASFLQAMTNERRRLRESATAARTSLRDERRALEAQKQRADALQERAVQLQQKLDALTELEKSLSDRPPPSR